MNENSVDIDDVREAVEKEMNGPGSLLGYRALHQKIRQVHGLSVPRNLAYAIMTEVNRFFKKVSSLQRSRS